MKVKHVLETQFSSWFPICEELSIPSKIIPLSNNFVEWLINGKFETGSLKCTVDEYQDCDSAFTKEEIQSNMTDDKIFPDIQESLKNAIEELGGSVFPKLNWSSPKDALWMNWTGDLKCTESEQIIMLLKSSDCIMHDLTEIFNKCEDKETNTEIDYYIVLRKWKIIEPASEFRCFVSHNKLIGISQRICNQHFSYLKNYTDTIKQSIQNFFDSKMKGKFDSHTYVFDVYLESMNRKEPKVVLVDVNPFGRVTDPHLFAWEELFLLHLALEQNQNTELILDYRYISEPIHIQPSISTSNAKPVESIDVTSSDGLLELIRLQRQQEKDSE